MAQEMETNRDLIRWIRAYCSRFNGNGPVRYTNRKRKSNPLNEDVPIRGVVFDFQFKLTAKDKREMSRVINQVLWRFSSPAWFACEWVRGYDMLILRLPLNNDK